MPYDTSEDNAPDLSVRLQRGSPASAKTCSHIACPKQVFYWYQMVANFCNFARILFLKFDLSELNTTFPIMRIKIQNSRKLLFVQASKRACFASAMRPINLAQIWRKATRRLQIGEWRKYCGIALYRQLLPECTGYMFGVFSVIGGNIAVGKCR